MKKSLWAVAVALVIGGALALFQINETGGAETKTCPDACTPPFERCTTAAQQVADRCLIGCGNNQACQTGCADQQKRAVSACQEQLKRCCK